MRTQVIGGILAVAVVASIGTTMAVAVGNDRPAQKFDGPAKSTVPTGSTGSTGSAFSTGIVGLTGTAGLTGSSVLPGGRWTALPAAPIVGRSDAAGVWTGDQMLVWGGIDPAGGRDYADGAGYDLTTRRWSTLPAAPLSARAATASVWTGHMLFVWGGTDARGRVEHDGATYDPSTRRWTMLPLAPVAAHSGAQALWTGTQVLLLTLPPGRSSDHVTLAAYDPSTRRWAVRPMLRLPAGHDASYVTGVVAGDRLLVWSHWVRTTKTHDGGLQITPGIDGYTYDLGRRVWTADEVPWRGHDSVDTALWTGRQVLIPASQLWCGYCPGPFDDDTAGVLVDPQTGSARPIPHGQPDDLGGDYLWTGSVLLAVNTTTSIGAPRPASTIYPGTAAYWQPAANTWTRLPSAPLAGGDAVTVWTGHSVLVWGQLFATHQSDPAHPRTAGLQLSR